MFMKMLNRKIGLLVDAYTRDRKFDRKMIDDMQKKVQDMEKMMMDMQHTLMNIETEMTNIHGRIMDNELKMLHTCMDNGAETMNFRSGMSKIEKSVNSALSGCKEEIEDMKVLANEQSLESASLLACYEYEYNDGDQIWSDTTSYYKKHNVYMKKFEEGYYGSKIFEIVSLNDILINMGYVRDQCGNKAAGVRGGYSILKDFDSKKELETYWASNT